MKKTASGGKNAIISSVKHLVHEKALTRGTKSLLKLNKDQGIDCPGCAWPDPKESSPTEFCENGAKAIAAETTTKKVDVAFFEKHSLTFLKQQSDYWLEQQGRLTHPMFKSKNSDHYEPIEWDVAFEKIAKQLRALENPNEAVFYTSGRTSNEAAFLYQLMGRQLGTNNFPDCSNLCHESSGVALSESIGIGKGTVTLKDFEHAEAIFVIGQNPATNHPRMLTDLQKAAKNGAEIVVVNPLKEKGLESFIHPQDVLAVIKGKATNITSKFLQPKIGGDLALLKGMIKYLLEWSETETDILDVAFIKKHCIGFEELKKDIENESWDKIEKESGLLLKEIELVAEIYKKSNATIICWAMGLTQQKHAVATLQYIVNLLLLKGNIGKKGAGACPVRGHSNVQGDRTMGIHENPPTWFLDKLQSVFNFEPPRNPGYNAVETLHALAENKVKVFMCLGGNYIAACPDFDFTRKAISNCELSVQVSTKLNRSHLETGQEALILPCLGRTEVDLQNGQKQKQTVEDSMSMVHATQGILTPISKELKSEPFIIASIAEKVFEKSAISWKNYQSNYDKIREDIAQVVVGFDDLNKKIKEKGGFYLGNSAADHHWKTSSKKAEFRIHPIPDLEIKSEHFRLTTVRSHDQYNTTVYGLNDRYRGVSGERNVLFMNETDALELKLKEGDKVTLTSFWKGEKYNKQMGLKIKFYEISRGCLASYFPESNILVPVDSYADKSFTPTSKFIEVSVEKM